jgi:thiol-disulfide isomerase/thioredoxin
MRANHRGAGFRSRRAILLQFVAFSLTLLACAGIGSSAGNRSFAADDLAAADGWLTNFEEAMAVSRQTGRPVLTVFTGSDWCPHCKTLEQNVLFTDTFRAWSAPNVVLLMIDLPQAGISQAIRSERSQVCIKYGVRTFPSVLLIGSDGTKLASQTGYTGQTAGTWIAKMSEHLPPAVAENDDEKVLESLTEAVESARGAKRPILLVVSRPGDSQAKSHSASLINDPEFGSFAHDHFVVARVQPTAESGTETSQSMENLLGGADLPSEAVELIVTDDGQTPLFSQSGRQPPLRLINGLKRFLAARQAARIGEAQTR